MSLLEELETLLETRQPYANGNAEKCYPLVAELIEQLRSAQQSAQADMTKPPITEDAIQILEKCFPHVRDQ